MFESKYKLFGVVCSVAIAFFGVYLFVWAGNIDSPTVPSDDSGRMYTLEQIYQNLHNGTGATKQSGGFTEPGSAPGSTMHTLDNIYDDFTTDITSCNGTVAADVRAGKTFFATSGTTRGADWGPVEGTIADGDNVSGADGSISFSIPNGYYSSKTCTAVDGDLVVGNIKSGVTILGQLGTFKALLPTTFQTVCYNTVGEVIACGGTDWPDQDADTSGDSASCVPTYTQGTYTVADSCTNLEWQRYGHGSNDGYTVPTGAGNCTNGTYSASYCKYTWQNALKYCSNLTLNGSSDWRLPNIKELQSIAKYSNFSPAIDTTKFSNTKVGVYWSSTTYVIDTTFAWYSDLTDGYDYGYAKTNTSYVRCVRSN